MNAMQQADRGLKFSGNVFGRLFGGDWFELGNTTSLQIKTSNDKDERISHKKDSFGQALDSLPDPKPAEISWTNNTFNKLNFAMMLMGRAADLDAAAQTVTDEAVTLKKGVWVELANRNLDPAQPFALTQVQGNAAVVPEDYEVNHNLGMVRLKTSSKLSGEVKAQAAYKTRTGGGFVIDAATLDNLELELRVDGKNRVTGEQAVLSVWRVNVAAEGDFDWLKGDWGEAKFSGTCVVPEGKNSPYRLESFAAYA